MSFETDLTSASSGGTPLAGALDAAALASQVRKFASVPPAELLHWALKRWRRRVAVVTSFQVEGMVLVDMAWRIDPEVRVITLDTGRLPEETYELIEKVRERYGIEVEVFTPDAEEVAAMVRRHGPNLFYRSIADRQTCCQVRKVEPLNRALSGLSAWVTGLRRDQAPSRARTGLLELDARHEGLIKINPLARWSWDDVWGYVESHGVPHHPLYDRGFTSIGCAPCTRPVRPGQDLRAGRWWWEAGEHKECGLHLPDAEARNGKRSTLLPVAT